MRHSLALTCLALAAQTPPPYVESQRKSYDHIYTSARDTFSAEPNRFLVRIAAGLKAGKALDVGMGQGRNAIWLASKGWTVTGFDVSPVAIDEAKREAAARRLKLEAVVTPYELFDWGREKWDLIVCSYFFPQEALPRMWESLHPGGSLMIEGFHADTGRVRPIGGGYTDKSMFEALKQFRILLYEDVEDRPEWGVQIRPTNRLVRVLAQKPLPPASGCEWQGKPYSTGESICFGAQWTCAAEGWKASGKCPQP
jgi:SAM-dependent methyltransferase